VTYIEAVLTTEQMEAAKIEPMYRDYCAHHLVEWEKCKRVHLPFGIKCKPYKHAWDECEFHE